MTEVRTAHTAELAGHELDAVRALLDQAFGGDFSDADWDHTLGGVHVTLREDGEVLAHGAVVQRRLLHGDRALRTGYVEGLAVRPGRQRQGHGTAVLDALERVVRAAYPLGALSATPEGERLYLSRGWRRWQGRTFVLAPEGLRRTPEEDDAVFVLPPGDGGTPLDLTGDLVCDWRCGDVW
ncbi:GNAT family N-acetyltransferase [Streptomyces sp. JJ36]|uniref:GNAT family N-acetyltransferase n=1 Tax=Streptomyces sp. JJ36 TaxID=2736645 RepID=UPI001F47C1EB|nr:GNAT family N-acetyltransferase [Streptomyces sp. JJ36]MCF6522949.1 GNAT family N-acetyltransferase [Streptomyces sp. JJ36]